MPVPDLKRCAPTQTAIDRERTLLDFAVSQSPAVFYIAELTGNRPIVFISSNVEALTGHKAADFLADPKYGRCFLHPDDLPAYERGLLQLKGRHSLTHEYRFRTTDGRYLWFRDQLRRIHNEATGRDEFVGCMIDVTAEKRVETRLREAEALNAAIIKSAQDAIVTIDANGAVLEFNPAAERMFGRRRGEMIGRPVGETLVPERLRTRLATGLARLKGATAGRSVNRRIETEALHADGRSFPVELTVGRAAVGARTVFVAEIRDISARVAAEAERERLARLLHDAVESMPSGFAITDAGERIVLCNTAFSAPYGVAPRSLVGLSREDLVRDFYPRLNSFDGEPISGTGAEIPRIIERLRNADVEPVEIEMKNGEWRLLSSVHTSDGGEVTIRTDITKLKRAEGALRDSERQFRSMVEDHPLPVSMIDVETSEILYESPAAAAIMGREWPAKGRRFVLDHYVDRERRKAYLERLRRTGEVRDFEVEVQRADGSRFWISITSRLINFQGRQVAIASHVDLTERRQRERELRQARETLEDAIESISEGFALYDGDDRLVMCNQSFRDFSGVVGDLIEPGIKWIDLVRAGAERGQYADALGRVEEWLEAWAAGRERLPITREFQQSDGRWFVSSSQRTRNGGIVVTRSETTQRKRMEQALRESEERIRHVVEACPVPIAMTRARDAKIVYESPALQQLFGRDPASTDTYATDYYADPRDREPYVAKLREVGAVDGLELKLRKLDGAEFWGSISARMIEYRGEEVIVSSCLDLTERLEVEAEMARQREALHQSEKLSALGELLAGVAHELNNPLSVVVGQALLLKETAADQRIADRAVKIGNAADRCARIVKTFLAMARRKPSESQAVNMNEVIESALEVTGYSLRASDIDVSLRLARELPPVWADSDQLNQVMTNLIVNAQHALQEVHGPRKLHITSCYRKHRDEIVIKLKDSGRGIPGEILSRIFEPFFTTKEVGTGTGIGLAVCHRIIEAHGGKIRVDSAPGEGASFVIRLPVIVPADAVASPGPCDRVSARSLSVLVIDDEEDVAEIVADILRGDGHGVVVADSGANGLRRIEAQDFDLILSDLRMPGLDGPSLHRILEKRRPAMAARLAFVTGDTMSPKIKRFLRSAGRPYIEKPITPRDVRELVCRVIGAAEAAQPKRC